MKALSLTQPWATLVVTGEKEVETRSWRTNHHGMIAIHAAKGFPKWAQNECRTTYFHQALWPGLNSKEGAYQLATEYIKELPRGAIIGVASITGCIRTNLFRDRLTYKEQAFGDYSSGRWAWLLNEPQMIEPIPCSGALSLWEVPADIMRTILERIGLREPRREAGDFVLS